MKPKARVFTDEMGQDWQIAAMVLVLPLTIAAVSFGCQFFL
jgi:hypothetical protein